MVHVMQLATGRLRFRREGPTKELRAIWDGQECGTVEDASYLDRLYEVDARVWEHSYVYVARVALAGKRPFPIIPYPFGS